MSFGYVQVPRVPDILSGLTVSPYGYVKNVIVFGSLDPTAGLKYSLLNDNPLIV
jgi:hypothetical protein